MNGLLFTGSDGKVKVECSFQDETLWLSQRLMADLFGVGVSAINKHLKNIVDSGELEEAVTISKMEIVRSEGGREVRREVDFYNLEVSNYPILTHNGKISAEEARIKAEAEYETFRNSRIRGKPVRLR